jgi:heptaprenyl diphosphate synthase
MNAIWNDCPTIAARLAEVEAILEDSLGDPTYPLAAETKELVLSGGKMLRPAFVLIGAGFGAQERRLAAGRAAAGSKIAHIAAAVELLHVASLIHDDVIDQADVRRGIPSLHGRFGTTNAILAGDWLFSRSFRLAADYASVKSSRALARFVGAICSAEISQDLSKFSFATTRRGYLRTIAGKTAALFSLSLHVGAAEAKAGASLTQALRRAGYDIGMAFQIIDDILDYESDDRTMGKPVGNDLKEGLLTLPLILALRKRGPELRPLLTSERLDDGAIAFILKTVADSGALDEARRIAASFTERARREIGRLPACPARDDLVAITESLLTRKY